MATTRNKIQRNDPCPCGSAKKYKQCHGSIQQREQEQQSIQYAIQRATAHAAQRERQQGHGRPIISTEVNGGRVVAVKNRLMHSRKWRTFHDFLGSYIKAALGTEWGNTELKKPLEQRHPILLWYHHVCNLQRQYMAGDGRISSMPMTGAVGAYMHLAYDLYALDHNAELQEKLIGRLKNADNFSGAAYEVFVAALMIRAGFDLVFEDEDNRQSTHCEFTATYKKTGRSFSVEAKHRTGNRFRLGRQLNRALRKQADHPRIVFIDINIPDNAEETEFPPEMEMALRDLRAFEGRVINGNPLPNAYLFITNTPWHLHLERQQIKRAVMYEGFQIPEFKPDFVFPSLREAINARDLHIEMHELFHSMRDHSEIPSTFDGEIPEFAFGDNTVRLLIGDRYAVTGEDGVERAGLLTSAVVVESEKKAVCVLKVEGGSTGLYSWPLSDAEMEAWKQHPNTFFGQVEQNRKANTPLELYDFFHESYRNTPKEKLLEFMAAAQDIDMLRTLDQSALASVYAERGTYGAIAAGYEVGVSPVTT